MFWDMEARAHDLIDIELKCLVNPVDEVGHKHCPIASSVAVIMTQVKKDRVQWNSPVAPDIVSNVARIKVM